MSMMDTASSGLQDCNDTGTVSMTQHFPRRSRRVTSAMHRAAFAGMRLERVAGTQAWLTVRCAVCRAALVVSRLPRHGRLAARRIDIFTIQHRHLPEAT
jgi:hypothetical protein